MNYKKIILILISSFISTLTFASASVKSPHYEIHYPVQVNQLLGQINPQNMWNNLTPLTQFPDRSVYHETGKTRDKLRVFVVMHR